MLNLNKRTTPDPTHAIRRLNVIGFILLLLFFAGLGGWSTVSELTGAVIGAGVIVVQSDVKKIQHASGGVVSELLVHDGMPVKEGQLLLRLDDTVPRATRDILRSQLDELITRRARLEAESDDQDRNWLQGALGKRSMGAIPDAAVSRELRLFDRRREAREGQRLRLQEQIRQIREEMVGVSGQRNAKDKELALIGKELKGVDELFRKNLVSIQRMMQLQRDEARLEGERNLLVADLARAEERIAETELQILQLDQEFHAQALADLKDADAKTVEVTERLTTAEDQLRRCDIRAPQAGFVHELAVHTVGGVVGAGEAIMLIVPSADDLVAETRIAPNDIDQVMIGGEALVRIHAGNQRTTPQLTGTVVAASPDLVHDPRTSQDYYEIKVALPQREIAKLGALKLLPGMPAEVFVRTRSRTPLQFLLKPLSEQFSHALRER